MENTVMKAFIKFLKENDAYMKYRINLEEYTHGRSKHHYDIRGNFYTFPDYPPEYLIYNAFYWVGTNEGWEYWSDLDYKWNKHLKNMPKEQNGVKEWVITKLKLRKKT